MLIEIQKTEVREIALKETRFVSYAERMYYRFTPVLIGESLEDNIEVLVFHELNNEFSLSVKNGLYESQINIVELTHVNAVEITEDEFNTKLQELLLKYI